MKLVQKPNTSIIIALVALLVSHLAGGGLHVIARAIYLIAIIIWAYEEIARGTNWFRRVLGSVVLIWVFYTLVR